VETLKQDAQRFKSQPAINPYLLTSEISAHLTPSNTFMQAAGNAMALDGINAVPVRSSMANILNAMPR
jgi:hypothetical protein